MIPAAAGAAKNLKNAVVASEKPAGLFRAVKSLFYELQRRFFPSSPVILRIENEFT